MRKIYLVLIFVSVIKISFSQNWQQFGNGIPSGGFNFYLDSINNKLYLLGDFVNQAGDTVLSPAIWDGTLWNPVGNFDFRTAGNPYKVSVFRDSLYLVGDFKKSLGAPGDYVLRLNGNIWDTLQFSPDATLRSLYEYQSQLYFGGLFHSFGPLSSLGLVIYQPPFWSTVPPSLYIPYVETMITYNGNLIAGGLFGSDQVGVNYKGNIIGWNGFNFFPLDNGLDLDGIPYPLILDLEVYNGKLYAAGTFRTLNVPNGTNIVSWNGQTWGDVGGGVNDVIRSLQVYNGSLYAAGSFSEVGGISADCIAKWDGTKWCSLGSMFNGSIFSMCVFNNELIITGAFTAIDGSPVNHIAKWVGGNFTDSCQTVGIDEINIQNQILIYPNPVRDILQITSDKFKIDKLKITDILGKEIYSVENNVFFNQLDVSFLKSGIYFLTLETKEGREIKKFVKE